MTYTGSCAMGLLYPRSKLMALVTYCLGSYNNGLVRRVLPGERCGFQTWAQNVDANYGTISIDPNSGRPLALLPGSSSYSEISLKHLFCSSQGCPGMK